MEATIAACGIFSAKAQPSDRKPVLLGGIFCQLELIVYSGAVIH